jgi:hypothetical protein
MVFVVVFVIVFVVVTVTFLTTLPTLEDIPPYTRQHRLQWTTFKQNCSTTMQQQRLGVYVEKDSFCNPAETCQ